MKTNSPSASENKTKIIWINRLGERREQSLEQCSYFYALDWFRRSIEESQGILSIDERRTSKLKLIEITNYLGDGPSLGVKIFGT